MEQNQTLRSVPQSEIDLQMLLTDPKWGMEVPPELKAKLTMILGHYQDEQGNIRTIQEGLWGLLSMYTRDIRLGNLSEFYGEVTYVRYYLDMAGDCLREGYIRAFMKSLSMAVTVLEVSQSRGGFLRKRQGTLTTESFKTETEPQKQSLFGKKQTKEGY